MCILKCSNNGVIVFKLSRMQQCNSEVRFVHAMTNKICTYYTTKPLLCSFTLLAGVTAPTQPHFAAITLQIGFFQSGSHSGRVIPIRRVNHRSVSASSSNPLTWDSFACVWSNQLWSPVASGWVVAAPRGWPSDSLEMFHYCCVANVQMIVSALYCQPLGSQSSFATVMIAFQIKPKGVMLILKPFHLFPKTHFSSNK